MAIEWLLLATWTSDPLDHTWALWGGGLEVNLAFKAVIPSTAPSRLCLAPLSGFSSP